MKRTAHRLSLPVLLIGCSTAAGCSVTSPVTEAAANMFVPVSQENQMGQQMSAEVEQELPILQDPELNAYVSEITAELLAAADDIPEGLEFTVKIVDDPNQINAFAIPGGNIYVYTGLLRAADSEAELASVLAHEIAHVTQRHIAERMVTQLGLQTVVALALGQNAGLLTQLASSIGAQGFLLKHSRDAERESDEVGMRYVVQAGYDPHGYVSFFSKLADMQQGGGMPTILQTHPDPEERVENAEELIAEMETVPQFTGRERYQRIIGQELGSAPSTSPAGFRR